MLFLNEKQQKVYNLFVEYINILVFFSKEYNRQTVNKQTLFYLNLEYYSNFFKHYSLFKFLIKCFKLFDNKTNRQKTLTLINRILKDKKEYTILTNKHDILLFCAFLNEYKNGFISYKKDIINMNKHNYIKKFKKNNVYMINLKTNKLDINTRYFLVENSLYNEYLQTINYSYFDLKYKKSFKIFKLYLLSKYNYMFVSLSTSKKGFTKRQYYNKNLNKSTKNIYLSELIYFIQYYNNLITLNEYNYYIVNNNSIFNHVRDYFTYYQHDKNTSIIEYFKSFNYNIINDISKSNNSNNTIYYKVILSHMNKDIKFLSKTKKFIIYLLNKDNITFKDIETLRLLCLNNQYNYKVFNKHFIKTIDLNKPSTKKVQKVKQTKFIRQKNKNSYKSFVQKEQKEQQQKARQLIKEQTIIKNKRLILFNTSKQLLDIKI